MKRLILLLFLSGILFSCDHSRSIDRPKWLTSFNMSGPRWRVELERVEFTDTATVLTFNYTATAEQNRIRFTKKCFLSDEKGREYKALFQSGKGFGKWIDGASEGTLITIGFEPLEKDVKVFDFIEGYNNGDFAVIGINDGNYRFRKPHYSRKEKAAVDKWKSGFFRKGEAFVSCAIEGYNPAKDEDPLFMEDDLFDAFTHLSSVRPDSLGNFSLSVKLDHPQTNVVTFKNRLCNILLSPGDSLSMRICENGLAEIRPLNRDAYPLQHMGSIPAWDRVYHYFESVADFDSLGWDGYIAKTYDYLSIGDSFADYFARKYRFTAFEYEYFRTNVRNNVIINYLDRRLDYVRQHYKSRAKADSLLCCEDLLSPLREFPAGDPMILASTSGWIPFNRFRYDPVMISYNRTLHGSSSAYQDNSLLLAKKDSALFGKRTLLGDVCLVRDSRRNMNNIMDVTHEPDSALAYTDFVKDLLITPAAKEKVESIYEDVMSKQIPFYDLPSCAGKDVLQSIISKYSGKYVFLEFWSTSCGPCVAQIKNWNQICPAEIRPGADIVPVFITDDSEQRYNHFVHENLQGCESIRLSRSDCKALWDMFNISGIPHHEIINPSGQASRRAPDHHGTPREVLRQILALSENAAITPRR
ncbi:MAG: hypothetical protein IJS07_05410 [Bacteroidales bacterium]|nr:hypothetical protein [Bacteroidales bacterium]